MDIDMSKYLQVFIDESKDNLQKLNDSLLILEHNQTDMETINDIFRVAHTLKGMAGSMNFVNMQKLTHQAENVLDEIRSGRVTVTSSILDVLFRCLDALENYVDCICETSSEGVEDYIEILDDLEKIRNGNTDLSEHKEANIEVVKPNGIEIKNSELPNEPMELNIENNKNKNAAIARGENALDITIRLADTCVLKSVRAFVIFNELERHGSILQSNPSIRDLEDEKFEDIFKLVMITKETVSEIESVINGISEIDSFKVFTLDKDIEEKPSVNSESTYETTKVPQVEAKHEEQAPKQQVSTKSVRVNIDRLDSLMNLVSELIIVKTQLEGVNSQNNKTDASYNESIEYLERITTSLNDAVMKVRMVPIESTFNRFPRMIRDVAKKLGKDIDLVISGQETELDRTVIDEIGDPLIHLLRNAADHGLETTENRIKAGKPSKGTINLKAYQDGNSVVIEVGDDGKGIDVKIIKEKAIEKGLISREMYDTMSDNEATALIMQPGFSTAKEVSDLSGRGVGLDVVRSRITALGGDVEIKTELGKGSTFVVRLPLTLAIIQSLMVNIGEEKYAIPLTNIQTIEDISKEDIEFVQKQEVIVIRDEIVPIVRLSKVLDIPYVDADDLVVVIAKKGEKQVGFIVDSLIGQQEIVIKPIGKHLSNINMIAGATILGNGEVALILDINTLV